jgi:phosphoribosylformylglycinamidine cyclo-ligase
LPVTYRQAGVDIDAGDDLVERIKPLSKKTRIAEVLADVGGFAGMCLVPGGIDEPVLVSGTDGVGTKLKVAFATGVHDTIGIDLVAMSVNDVVTTGARPLFFLDYFATGKLDVDVAEKVIAGIARGCELSGCALLGGETAELPGMYAEGEYDLAGFCVGVVGRSRIVDGSRVTIGDTVIGLPSSGLHSNGYSLARKVLPNLDEKPAELRGETVAQALLSPTRLYAKVVQAVLAQGHDVRAMCHVTGGGIPGNFPRVLPDGLGASIRAGLPRESAPIFDLVATRGPVEAAEMRRTFNCGVGFIMVVPPSATPALCDALRALGEAPVELGAIVNVSKDTPFEERVRYDR